MALSAHKQQPLFRAIVLARKPAAGTHLAGVIRVYVDAERTRKSGFVAEEPLQLSKGPFRRMPVGLALFGSQGEQFQAVSPLLWARFPLTDTSEVFQSDESRGEGIHNAFGNGVIGIQLKPSLSLAQGKALGALFFLHEWKF